MDNQQHIQTQVLLFSTDAIRQTPELCKEVIAWYETVYSHVKVPQRLELALGAKADERENWLFIEEQIANYKDYIAKYKSYGNVVFVSKDDFKNNHYIVNNHIEEFSQNGWLCRAYLWDGGTANVIEPFNSFEEENKEEPKITEEPSWIDELVERIAEKVVARLKTKAIDTDEVNGVPNDAQSHKTTLELFPEIQEDKMVTAKEASKIFKASENTIFVYAKKGGFSYYKSMSGRYTFNLKEMAHFFKNNPLRNSKSQNRFK